MQQQALHRYALFQEKSQTKPFCRQSERWRIIVSYESKMYSGKEISCFSVFLCLFVAILSQNLFLTSLDCLDSSRRVLYILDSIQSFPDFFTNSAERSVMESRQASPSSWSSIAKKLEVTVKLGRRIEFSQIFSPQ